MGGFLEREGWERIEEVLGRARWVAITGTKINKSTSEPHFWGNGWDLGDQISQIPAFVPAALRERMS